MKLKRMWLPFMGALVLVTVAGSYRIWADNNTRTFTIDVACDART